MVICISEPPTITPFTFPTDLSEGSSAQVFCAISKGTTPVYFTWLKDGKTLREDKDRITTSDRFSALLIPSVSAADVGNYTCFAKNLQGTDSHSVMLEVRGKLNHPQNCINNTGFSIKAHNKYCHGTLQRSRKSSCNLEQNGSIHSS